MRSRALSRGDHGCCAAAVRPPFSAASRQRCSSRDVPALSRARPRRWLLRRSSAAVYYYSYPCAVLVVHRLDAARRRCCRRASLFLSSGAQAAAARHEAMRARGNGCCAAVVPRYTTPVYYVLVYALYQPCSAVAVALRGAEAIRPSLPCCLCGLQVRCQLCCCAVGACCTSAVWATPAAPLPRALLLALLACFSDGRVGGSEISWHAAQW